MRVCMFVYNNCTRDARVLKEADALAGAGHAVTVVAVLDQTTVAEEWRDRVRIIRVDRNPPHYRLLRMIRAVSRLARLSRARAIRAAELVSWAIRFDARAFLAMERTARRLRQAVGTGVREQSATPLIVAATATALPVALALGALATALGWVARRTGGTELSADDELRPAGPAASRGWARVFDAPWALLGLGAGLARRLLLSVHKPLMFADYYRQARVFARRQPADVYHAHDLNTLPAAVLAARDSNAWLVYDAHELYSEISTLSIRERRIWVVIERLLIRRADRVLTVCDSIADELTARYGVARPLVLLNCPDTPAELFVPASSPLRAKLGLPGRGEPIILYHGGFAPNRGLPALVRAGALLDRGVIALMGWGRLEPELAALIDELDLHERVLITAPVPQEEVLAFVAGADVGVIPYEPIGLNNTYTTPNKLFDYMAVGLPIAASHLPELVRFVRGLDVGVTFTQATPDLIAQSLNELLEDPMRSAQMRANGLRASRTLRWEVEKQKLVGLYDSVGETLRSNTNRGRRPQGRIRRRAPTA